MCRWWETARWAADVVEAEGATLAHELKRRLALAWR